MHAPEKYCSILFLFFRLGVVARCANLNVYCLKSAWKIFVPCLMPSYLVLPASLSCTKFAKMQHQLANFSGLDSSLLSHEISPSTKAAILDGLWGSTSSGTKSNRISDFDAYFAYYRRQCTTAFHDNGRHISIKTHRDIIHLADEVKSNRIRGKIWERLRSKDPGPQLMNKTEIVDNSIDLTVRVLLMMDIGELKFGFRGQAPLLWTTWSLKDWIHNHFDKSRQLDSTGVRLEKLFNARNLQRIGGFEIQWTDNLADHLRIINEGGNRVAIFHHASFLKSQKDK